MVLNQISCFQDFVGDEDDAEHHLDAEEGDQEDVEDGRWSSAEVKTEIEPRKFQKRFGFRPPSTALVSRMLFNCENCKNSQIVTNLLFYGTVAMTAILDRLRGLDHSGKKLARCKPNHRTTPRILKFKMFFASLTNASAFSTTLDHLFLPLRRKGTFEILTCPNPVHLAIAT